VYRRRIALSRRVTTYPINHIDPISSNLSTWSYHRVYSFPRQVRDKLVCPWSRPGANSVSSINDYYHSCCWRFSTVYGCCGTLPGSHSWRSDSCRSDDLERGHFFQMDLLNNACTIRPRTTKFGRKTHVFLGGRPCSHRKGTSKIGERSLGVEAWRTTKTSPVFTCINTSNLVFCVKECTHK